MDESWPKRSISAGEEQNGGIVKVGNYLYGDFDDREALWCWTPEPVKSNAGWRWTETDPLVTYADGRLYFRYQDGIMALVDASPLGGFRQVGYFKIPDGMKKSWAHRVVYLRGLNKILCYDGRDPGRAVVPAPVNRVWTDSTGRFKVEARLKGVNQGKAILEKSDGSVFEISLDRLSSSDQAYLRSL